MSMMIVNILSNFLGDYLSHKEDSGQVRYNCPACDENRNKGNLEVNYYKDKFNCWSCGKVNNMHGSVEKLIKKYGSKSNLKDYILIRPDKEHIDDFLNSQSHSQHVSLPEEFKLLKDCDETYPRYKWAMFYLKQRGITKDIIEEFNIGFVSEGFYRDRIIIPSYDENGVLNYFISRSFNDKIKPKYLNPKVEKQTITFNENKINFDSTIFLVEGVFDHIVIPNSIQLLGKVVSDKLKYKLNEEAKADIVILLDGDAIDDAVNLFKELNFDNLKNRIKLCIPPDGLDPSLVFEQHGKKGIIDFLRSNIKVKQT